MFSWFLDLASLVLPLQCLYRILLFSLQEALPPPLPGHFTFPEACPSALCLFSLLRKPIPTLARVPTKPSALEPSKPLLYFPCLDAFKNTEISLAKIFCLLAQPHECLQLANELGLPGVIAQPCICGCSTAAAACICVSARSCSLLSVQERRAGVTHGTVSCICRIQAKLCFSACSFPPSPLLALWLNFLMYYHHVLISSGTVPQMSLQFLWHRGRQFSWSVSR